MIISIDLKAKLGFLKKPDVNDTIYLTYNFIHKPALLGIFGAILGLSGHREEGKLSEYYKELKDLKIGIMPISSKSRGNFDKTTVKYNDATGISNSGKTLNIREQIILEPVYRIYIVIDESIESANELSLKLKENKAVFIPYLGKNEFPCWWENYTEYDMQEALPEEFKVMTLFEKKKKLKRNISVGFSLGMQRRFDEVFAQFERLPVGFDENLKQYSELKEFVYTNMKFSRSDFFGNESFKYIVKESNYSNNDINEGVIYVF